MKYSAMKVLFLTNSNEAPTHQVPLMLEERICGIRFRRQIHEILNFQWIVSSFVVAET